MKIEIEDNNRRVVEDEIDVWEGTISHTTKKEVFWVSGDYHTVYMNFEDESELEKFIKALQYFKEHKTYPPTF